MICHLSPEKERCITPVYSANDPDTRIRCSHMLVGVPDSPCKPPRRPQCAYTQLLRLKPCTAPRPQALTKPSAAFEMPAVHSTLRVPHRLRHTQPAPGSGPSSRRRLTGKLPPPDRTTRFRASVQAQAHARECADETVGVTLQRLNQPGSDDAFGLYQKPHDTAVLLRANNSQQPIHPATNLSSCLVDAPTPCAPHATMLSTKASDRRTSV